MATATIPQAVQALPDPMVSFKADEARFEQQTAQVNQDRAAAETALKERQAAQLRPLEQQREQMGQQFGQMLERGPAQVQMPQNTAAHIDPKQMQDMGGIMLALAGLAGVMTRQPMMVSMRGMTGALQGLQAGDQKQFEEGYQQYKVNLDAALRQNDQKIREFDRIIKSNEFNIREKDAQIKALLRQHGDEMGSAMVPFQDRIKHIEDQRKATDKIRAESLRFEEAKIRLQMQAARDAETASYHRQMLAQKGESRQQKAAKATAGAGSNNARFAGKMVEGQLAVESHVDAIMALPAGAGLGTFSDLSIKGPSGVAGALRALAGQKITDIEDRTFQQDAAALETELGVLALQGQSGGLKALSDELKSIRPHAGDSKLAMMKYLALARQAVELSAKGLKIWPGATDEMKEMSAETAANIRKSVPWTSKEVNQYIAGGEQNIGQAGAAVFNKPAATPQIPNAAPQQRAPDAAIQHLRAHPELKEQFRQKYGYLPE